MSTACSAGAARGQGRDCPAGVKGGEITCGAHRRGTPDDIRTKRALKGMPIPRTGQAGTKGVGLIVTKCLVIRGDPQVTTTAEHRRGEMLSAFFFFKQKTAYEITR